MLDYEIEGYTVYWKRMFGGRLKRYCHEFDTEDDAINFVIEHRKDWVEWRLVQTRVAIY